MNRPEDQPTDQPTDHPTDQPTQAWTPSWRTDTAERPAVPAEAPAEAPAEVPEPAPGAGRQASPPPAGTDGPRFPLFADEAAPADADATSTLPAADAPATDPVAPRASRRRGPGVVAWLVVAAVLLLAAAVGVWLFLAPGDGVRASRSEAGSAASGAEAGRTGAGQDLDGDATAAVSDTAPPNQDFAGERVSYEPANLLDGDPSTCWRMPGDGTGEEIVISFDHPVTVTSVGLVNGYAKSATNAQGRSFDWYHGNRRVTSVSWVLDDETTVSQDLDDTTKVQSVDVPSVTTSTVRLELTGVSEPGTGPARRDYTAVSDLRLLGHAG